MDENKKLNIIVFLLVLIIVALVAMQIFNVRAMNKLRINDANSKNVTVIPTEDLINKSRIRNSNYKMTFKNEPVYGSKEYFEQLDGKHKYKATQNPLHAKPQVRPSAINNEHPVPVSKTVNTKSSALDNNQDYSGPIGKTLNGNIIIPTRVSEIPRTQSAPSPSLSPSKNSPVTNKNGIDGLREPDFGPYMRNLQRSVKMNWNPPKGKESERVVTSFKIAKNGSLMDVNIKKSSGNKLADEAAINAIKNTHFEPLPNNFQKNYVDIQFTFDYNVFSATRD